MCSHTPIIDNEYCYFAQSIELLAQRVPDTAIATIGLLHCRNHKGLVKIDFRDACRIEIERPRVHRMRPAQAAGVC
jgi:hypothetical protein